MLTGILPPSSGQILYKGRNISQLTGAARREYELGVQMIFQDPFSSLNPRMRVIDIIGEGPVVHGLCTREGKEAYAAGLTQKSGMDAAHWFRYVQPFAGDPCQSLGIDRAME